MKRLSIALAALAAIAICGSALGDTSLDVNVLAKGEHSKVKYATYQDIHTQADFDKFMATAFEKDDAPSIPTIDWTKQMAIMAFIGYQKHTGYMVKVTKATETDSGILIHVKVVIPCQERSREEDRYPFTIVTIPANTKAVTFDTPEQDSLKC